MKTATMIILRPDDIIEDVVKIEVESDCVYIHKRAYIHIGSNTLCMSLNQLENFASLLVHSVTEAIGG